MLYGKRPFGDGQLQDKVLSNDHTMLKAREVHFPEQPNISPEDKDFIRKCLTYDQAFRPTVAQLCENPYILKKQFD
jgi:tousled-like kinase